MNEIASLFAKLGFRYDRSNLDRFRTDLKKTAGEINSASDKSIGGATEKARQKQNKLFQEIKSNYSKVKPSLMQMRNDLKRIDQGFKQNELTHKEYMEARKRVTERIHQMELRKERDHQRAIDETAAAHRKQVAERKRQIQELIAAERRLTRAEAMSGDRGDPRQVGNHRLISAIHSDTGLGLMVGAFAGAQSSRAYQEFIGVQQGLNAATGSAEKGAEELEFLEDMVDRLGISFSAAADGYKNFVAATARTELAGAETRKIFEAVSSYAKVLNLSADDTSGVMRA